MSWPFCALSNGGLISQKGQNAGDIQVFQRRFARKGRSGGRQRAVLLQDSALQGGRVLCVVRQLLFAVREGAIGRGRRGRARARAEDGQIRRQFQRGQELSVELVERQHPIQQHYGRRRRRDAGAQGFEDSPHGFSAEWKQVQVGWIEEAGFRSDGQAL